MYKTLFHHFKATSPDFTDEDCNKVIKAVSVKEYPQKSILWKQGEYVRGGGYVYKMLRY